MNIETGAIDTAINWQADAESGDWGDDYMDVQLQFDSLVEVIEDGKGNYVEPYGAKE